MSAITDSSRAATLNETAPYLPDDRRVVYTR